MFSELAGEFHSNGKLNTFALKYCALLMFLAVGAMGTYWLQHGEDNLIYVAEHGEEHAANTKSTNGKIDDLMDQMNRMEANSIIREQIMVKTIRLDGLNEDLASVKRVIERAPSVGGRYLEDRDRYVFDIATLESELIYLKELL